ncbi:MAG: hypothetical protein KGJ99_11450 [Betaproteobacteria bacterium]|nr:hypothetical protein [Betaproteobacteria bacterium]
MIWLIGLALLALGIYFVFLRKPDGNEIVVRTEPTSEPETTVSVSPGSSGEEKDNWERFDFYAARMLPASGRYRIYYQDQRGLKTERDIEVKLVHESAGQYAIDAHCLLRNAHRTFLNERIQRAVNLDTGEITENLARNAIAQYSSSGEGRALAAMDKEWMGVAILAFVCRADGQMLKPKRQIVAEYLKRRCPTLTLDDSDLDAAIKSFGEPDHREFKRIVRDLRAAGKREQLSDLLDCANRIVATGKTTGPMEKAALTILSEAVS